jgi:hypothetical protein
MESQMTITCGSWTYTAIHSRAWEYIKGFIDVPVNFNNWQLVTKEHVLAW